MASSSRSCARPDAPKPKSSSGPVVDTPLGKLACTVCYDINFPELFRALADATRRLILDELRDRDGQTLFELCARLAMKHGLASSRQAISQHLAVLEGAGLVHAERRGRSKYHHLDVSPLGSIAERWPIPREEPEP